MATKKTRKKTSKKVGVSVVITAAAAVAAAGAYFLYGSKNAARNRKKVKGWTLKAKGEVLERMEKMKDLSRDDYESLVDNVMIRYRKAGSAGTAEINKLARELKSHWKHLSKKKTKKRKSSPKKRTARKVVKRRKR